MNGSSNLLVLGVTGQVGKHVAQTLKRREAIFSVGSRRKANLGELADQFGASRFIDLDDPRTFDEALKNVTGIDTNLFPNNPAVAPPSYIEED